MQTLHAPEARRRTLFASRGRRRATRVAAAGVAWVVAAAALGLTAAATAAAAPVRLEPRALDDGPLLLRDWEYLPGEVDAPLPDHDAAWRELADTALAAHAVFPEWSGSGWFRATIDVDAAWVGETLALRLDHPGASEVYFDGEALATFGVVASDPAAEVPHNPRGVPTTFSPTSAGPHELLLHYSCAIAADPELVGWVTIARGAGFRARLDRPSRAIDEISERRLAHLILNIGALALALGFAMTHGLVYALHPRYPGNLWFAIFSLGIALNGGIESFLRWGHVGLLGSAWGRLAVNCSVPVIFAALLALLGTAQESPRPLRPVRWLLWTFPLVLLSQNVPALAALRSVVPPLWMLGVAVAALVLVARAWRTSRARLTSLGLSVVGLVTGTLTEAAKHAGLLGPVEEVIFAGGSIVMMLSGVSLFLARRIAMDGRELESLNRELEARVGQRTAELRASEQAANAANEAKSAFLATMSHEIRTPINAIVGMSELLAKAELGRDARTLAATLKRSALSLLSLVGEVLDLSRIEAGRLEIDEAPFAVRELVGELLDLFAILAAKKGLGLAAAVADDVPRRIVGDFARIRQVLVNLIGNAIKFTAAGRVDVDVRRDGDDLVFAVTDTGAGIPAAAIERLFEPFFQADEAHARRRDSSGLGLAISKRLVDAMGGAIEVASVVDQGTTFTVRVPAAEADEADEPSPPAPTREPSRPAAPTADLRILVAEDDPVNQLVLNRMFALLGYAVDVVDDGPKAVEAARAGAYDLVFLDLNMPGFGGLEAARRIRAEPPASRPWLVASTASVLPRDQEACRDAGMDDFVAKPVQLAELEAAIARYCARESDDVEISSSARRRIHAGPRP
ncbi:MAG: ATP-binding protein [Nannocystaceae bacterium]